MFKNAIKDYLTKLQETINKGDAREESYYEHLANLIKDFARLNHIEKCDITILPKKTEAGNPDFRIWDGRNHITGYIEAKDPSEANLDIIETSEQLTRYRETFPNVILTNFYEFRLYRDSQLIKTAIIARAPIALRLQTTPAVENEDAFTDLLNTFFSFSLPYVRDARTLASELAKRTRFLRDEVISIELAEEEKQGKKAILGFYEAFKNYLIKTLNANQFADLYSQTITYSLFVARTRANGEFNRRLAYDYIPHTIGILRDMFRFISLEEPPKSLQIIVDDIAEVLSVADVNQIFHKYLSSGKGSDPIIHFYETFLEIYNPELRERRGVYYTPESVVSFIVDAVHSILKTHFELPDGLANENVNLLDPAGGTLTFPALAIQVAADEYKAKYGEGGLQQWIKKHILQNFYAFELMMAPYAVGHLKIGFVLEELGYKMTDDERFKLYLTNTLDMDGVEVSSIPGLSSLSEESSLAGKIKSEQPILVIIGNPPYSGLSENINEWTERLLKENLDGTQSYYYSDGKLLSEKNPKWLQDDYVKFLRFAQWKIQRSGFGVVGMITNHSYLDNPTFRGMRQSLMKTFDEIYVLDLHGNSLKQEISPDGKKDENVFEIRQGVAIAIFVKNKNQNQTKVYHCDLFGSREQKYHWLKNHLFDKSLYTEIKPSSPYYFFVKTDTEKIKYYLKWKKINEIFPLNSVGIVTARDRLTIKWTEDEAWKTVLNFYRLDDELARRAFNLGKDVRDWKIVLAKRDLEESGLDRDKIRSILYRPFDIRYTYYTGKSRGFLCRPRRNVMRHMLHENLGIIFSRQGTKSGNLPIFISKSLVDAHSITNAVSISYIAPLYRYPNSNNKKNNHNNNNNHRKPNISPEILDKLQFNLGQVVTPEELLYYVYGVLHNNIYRKTYAAHLKTDFPRIPFTSNPHLFRKMCEFGRILAELHLLESKLLDTPIAKYQGKGNNDRIKKVTYNEKEERIYINKDKHFENVSSETWNYFIGGYQVLLKYLKDRKNMEIDDPRHFCRVITAISKTIEIQKQIDEIYPELENYLIE